MDSEAKANGERTGEERKSGGDDPGRKGQCNARRIPRQFRPKKKENNAEANSAPAIIERDPEDTVEGRAEVASEEKKKRPARRCRYFNTARGCRLGEECPFRHVAPKERVEAEGTLDGKAMVEPSNQVESEPSKHVERKAVVGPSKQVERKAALPAVQSVRREEEGSEKQRGIVQSEIIYFLRRFPGSSKEVDDDGSVSLSFNYRVTEPDWPFDINSLHLVVRLPASYPISPALLSNHSFSDLPYPLKRHIESELQRDIDARHSSQSAVNEFNGIGKWLTRRIGQRILSLFVGGLKKTKLVFEAERAGISLVMPQQDTSTTAQSADGEEGVNEMPSSGMEEEQNRQEEVEEEGARVYLQGKDIPGRNVSQPSIELELSWSDASGNIATLEADELLLVLTCARCGEIREHASAVDGKRRSARCSKCGFTQSLVLNSSIVHSGVGGSVMARVESVGCRPLELVLSRSSLHFACLSCNRLDNVHNISYGTSHKSWCHGCHSLCEFTILSTRFHGLHSRNEDHQAAASLPKQPRSRKTETVKGGPLVEGQPLPGNGTCQHYKKSYRWFRFPCCGRLYPCDLCHEDIIKGEHEMKIANRMICGFCSHEQPFQLSKPCIKCNSDVTRRRTQFWEGGKGCRDQKRMSRNDVHKYANSRKKTVAKAKP